MTSSIRLSGPLGTLLKVVAVLLLVDWLVAHPFFNRYVRRNNVTAYSVSRHQTAFGYFRDRTSGDNPAVLFDTLRRTPRRNLRIALVGDSTMWAEDAFDWSSVPWLAALELLGPVGRLQVDMIDSSEIGLFASDAALFIDKLLGSDVDIIVYGVTLRALPKHPFTPYVTRIREEMSVADLMRLTRAGAGAWVAENLDAERVLAGVVRTSWATYAYRANLRRAILEAALQPVAARWPSLERALAPASIEHEPAMAPRRITDAPYDWTRSDYGGPNPNWQALEVIGRLCARYAPQRCIVYAAPVNPFGRERLAEPGLYEEYRTFLQGIALRYGIVWRDYTDAMSPAEFRRPKYGGLRDPVHPNRQGREKMAELLREPIMEAVGRVLDRGGAPAPDS